MVAAQRASQGAVAAERRQRAKETGTLASHNPPAADTAALSDARGRHRPEGGQTDDYQHAAPNQGKSAAGVVQLFAIKDT